MDASFPIPIILALCVSALEVLYIRRRIRQRNSKQTMAESTMVFFHRYTLFKVTAPEDQQKLIDAFVVMGRNQVKVCLTRMPLGASYARSRRHGDGPIGGWTSQRS